MHPSCVGHEQNRETCLKELEWVVNGGRKVSTPLMWIRIGAQAFAVLLMLLALYMQ